MFTDTLAKDIMTRNVLTVSEEWTVPELARFLTSHSISGAPVTNGEGKLVGVCRSPTSHELPTASPRNGSNPARSIITKRIWVTTISRRWWSRPATSRSIR